MTNCYIVIHKNYDEGVSAYAFYKEDHAIKSVEEDVKTVEISLAEGGYETKTTLNIVDDCLISANVVANDGDIYYEWEIFPSEIQ